MKDANNEAVVMLQKIQKSEDPILHFQEIIDHLKQITGATEVYAAQLTKELKPTKEDDDENAHIDSNANTILRCTHDTSTIVKGNNLPNDGVVIELF